MAPSTLRILHLGMLARPLLPLQMGISRLQPWQGLSLAGRAGCGVTRHWPVGGI